VDKLHQLLHRVFGFDSFRPNQEEIVRNILRRRDVVAILPTGSGKSLCYQLPARVRKGTCVVVSPLIALMKDQVDAARAAGIRASFLNSSLTREQAADTYRALRWGDLDLLYIAPERFALEGFTDTLSEVNINLFAVDEAHCVSEWGLDFRPDYLSLSHIKEKFPSVPLAAFTATATLQAQKDIITRLRLADPFILRASFDRPNLNYEVRPKESLDEQIAQYIASRPGDCGIVYRTARKSTEATATHLRRKGIKALPYHAGLDAEDRKKNQDRFMSGEATVIVATIAFGMGIDKPDIRFVLHGDLPKNMESYYQETGRAGRDGQPSDCILFFGYGDLPRLEFLIKQADDEKFVEIGLKKLQHVKNYAERDICRRRAILAYFDEAYGEDNCAACDICCDNTPTLDATDDAKLLLNAIADTGERFGARFVIQVLRGEAGEDERIMKYGHHLKSSFSAGHHKKEAYWKRILNALIAEGAVTEDGEYRTLTITRPGLQLLSGMRELHIRSAKPGTAAPRKSRKTSALKSNAAPQDEPTKFDRELFETLRRVRAKLAARSEAPPYRVCSDRTLKHICADLPRDPQALARIPGIGPATLEKYGRQLLRAVEKYGPPMGEKSHGPKPAAPKPIKKQPAQEQPANKQPDPKPRPEPIAQPAPEPSPKKAPPPTSPPASKLPAEPPADPDAPLRRELLKLRTELATRDMRPPELVFIDSTIDQLVSDKPVTIEQFGKIYGIGAAKAKEYGPDAIEIINKYVQADKTRNEPESKKRRARKPRPKSVAADQPESAADTDESTIQNPALHDRLKTLRSSLALQHKMLPHYVYSNKTIDALCRVMPRTRDDLLVVPGIGPRKADRFGDAILDAIEQAIAGEDA